MRRLMLQTIDMLWVEHLEVMDYLRSSVNLRAYGQRDPLVEYKREGLNMFKEMQWVINEKILHFIPSMGAGAFVREQQQLQAIHEQAKSITEKAGSEGEGQVQKPIVNQGEKLGRNDLCSCGSGKKYKKCCGK